MGKVEFTEGQLKRIKELYRKGMPVKTIARFYGCDNSTIWRRLRDMGCFGKYERRDGQIAIVDNDEIKRLYLDGYTQNQISVQLGCGLCLVHNRLVDMGLSQGKKWGERDKKCQT